MISRILWAAQILLALGMASSGVIKQTLPDVDLAMYYPYFPPLFMRFIGVCEVLGAIGVIVPAALRIRPELTPLAAAGLAIIMAGAVVTTLMLGAFSAIAIPLVLFLLALFVAYGRWQLAPIAPRDAQATR
ncbi:MAG: DoxX family protein [Thermomicrobiales bacterium]|nr:DoxX family protein [Thermomicrobiales bacterium]